MMLQFRMIAVRSNCRMRSVSELKLMEYRCVLFIRIRFNLQQPLTNHVDNAQSLAVGIRNWRDLAEIIAAAD